MNPLSTLCLLPHGTGVRLSLPQCPPRLRCASTVPAARPPSRRPLYSALRRRRRHPCREHHPRIYPLEPHFYTLSATQAHPHLTLRTRTRGVPIDGTSRCARYTTLTCLVCEALVYRVYQIVPIDIQGKEGPLLPTEDWVEDEIMKSSTGWIQVDNHCLVRPFLIHLVFTMLTTLLLFSFFFNMRMRRRTMLCKPSNLIQTIHPYFLSCCLNYRHLPLQRFKWRTMSLSPSTPLVHHHHRSLPHPISRR